MTSTPLVSIIAIFLNGERFMREAVESVFAQEYPAWEHVPETILWKHRETIERIGVSAADREGSVHP